MTFGACGDLRHSPSTTQWRRQYGKSVFALVTYRQSYRILTSGLRPPLNNSLKLRKAVGCGGPGLQDQERFHFVEILVPHSRDLPEASPRHHPLGVGTSSRTRSR
jgi:hypothetical protein